MIYIRLFFSILSLLMILAYFVYLYILKKKIGDSLFRTLLYKRNGIQCYSCSEVIITDPNQSVQRIIDDVEDLSLCKSCQREVKLSNLLHDSNFLLLFKKWVLTKKSEKIMVAFLFIPIIPMILSFLFFPSIMNIASLCNNMFLTFYWSIMIYRVFLNTK
jgi:hypothetical protein